MSTAPPPTRMPLFTDPLQLHATSSYLSPASPIASESSSFSWTSIAPHQDTTQSQRKKSRNSPAAAMAPAQDGHFTFITTSTLDGFKSKSTMTTVRKKAMDSYLRDEKNKDGPRKASADRTRLNSEGSDSLVSSIGDQEVVTAPPAGRVPRSRQSHGRARQPSSTAPSSTAPSSSESGDRHASSPGKQMVKVPKSAGTILSPTPIVLPSRTNIELPYDVHVSPPLASLGKSLDPFRTMFQASNPHISVEELKFHCSRYFGTRGLGRYWIPTCLSYPHTFLSTLCLASAHHDIIYERPVESLATSALRHEIMVLVGRNMLNPDEIVADHNIVAVTQLIIGEVIGREESSLVWHEAGIENMIKKRGGLNQLGMNGRLASSISWVTLASAILREAKPRSMYADFCASHSSKKYHLSVTIPESPIYCPHREFVTIQRSPNCKTPEALDLLNDVRMMIDLFLHETKQKRRNSSTLLNLYEKITNSYIPISELRKTNVLTAADWKYEAIRVAAVVQATAIIRRIPLSEALTIVAAPKPSTLDTSSLASRSSESLVSPFDMRQDTPLTEYSTSPEYSTYSTSPAIQQNGFPFHGQRPSFSSTHSSSNMQRPSFSSTYSTSSDLLFFPPPRVAAPSGPTLLLRSLKDALESSNLSECWSDMAGVLLWIGLVMGAASRKTDSENKILKKYFSATAMRAGIMLCFEHPEAIHYTMLRMSEVIEGLGVDSTGEIVRKESDGPGKRMRT
ncbi:hypothetical protein BKA66DRAFT_414591 [Pyrenochaeta sp. MPI-SDFR-AT-0127]|nr:hypothetical protein BKA66DRAFT_414591 [Pyrenochaeta sp. MPI-SDFR-AT-0127]